MSKELVERLRSRPNGLCVLAANEIERQRKVIEEAFGLLRQMDEAWCSGMDGDDVCAEYALRIRTLTNKADSDE